MEIYVPKRIVDVKPNKSSPLFFLAGPIRGAGDWQSNMALELAKVAPDCIIACPSRWKADHFLFEYFHQPFTPDAPNRQRRWEEHYLLQAGLSNTPGCVIFWLGCESSKRPHPGPEPYAMDTRRELGEWRVRKDLLSARVAIGAEEGFYGLDTLIDSWKQGNPKFQCQSSIRDTAIHAHALAIRRL